MRESIIVPAILPLSLNQLKNDLKKIKSFSDCLQLDITDGNFTASKTVSLSEIEKEISFNDFFLEIHLMVNDPFNHFSHCQKVKAKRVFIHYESLENKQKLINGRKKLAFELGLAINPSTSLDNLIDLIPSFDWFLFLTVNPGFQGQKLITSVLKKIKKFKAKFPEKKVGLDGGVNDENIHLLKKLNLDEIVVGSFILKSKDPGKNYLFLKKIFAT